MAKPSSRRKKKVAAASGSNSRHGSESRGLSLSSVESPPDETLRQSDHDVFGNPTTVTRSRKKKRKARRKPTVSQTAQVSKDREKEGKPAAVMIETVEEVVSENEQERRVTRSHKGLIRVNYAASDESEFLEQTSTPPEKPRIRTLQELKNSLPSEIVDLVLKFAFKPGRDVDSNAPLYAGSWQFSHSYGRREYFLLGYRIASELGVIFDLHSFMNITQRGHHSHFSSDHKMEIQISSLGDISMFINHCEKNKERRKNGEKPLSFVEEHGYEPGTVFTSTIFDLGRDTPVDWFANIDGRDLDFAGFRLRPAIPGTRLTRKRYSAEHPMFVIPAMLSTIRCLYLEYEEPWAEFDFDINTVAACTRVYNYAQGRGWFSAATEKELEELVALGALESTTCPTAVKFRGLDGTRDQETFFSAKPEPRQQKRSFETNSLASRRNTSIAAPPSLPVTPTTAKRVRQASNSPIAFVESSPPQPAKKTRRLSPQPESPSSDVPPDFGVEETTLCVRELPKSAQKLRSTRPIRPPFRRKIIDGEERWVLPEEWLANPPPNYRAPARFAAEYSLFPRDCVVDPPELPSGDESDTVVGVAGPGPSTMASHAGVSSKKAGKRRA
ncbi:hypothetical protein CYLTODRAFT_488064 [Cylindrobasidium torrendii FP15055 ss-10]|uniref:Uncharacterized protein n=1 Tax=Cylindrobasidium torrendii FP15055 ss-10 TaxID=1314674 RepID=A0A0D7BJV7_9AGAR|nr:hypothetical protein CYLTODRAFT_488064 [Cylindrobasidium torrendii FP15055 ss-10]